MKLTNNIMNKDKGKTMELIKEGINEVLDYLDHREPIIHINEHNNLEELGMDYLDLVELEMYLEDATGKSVVIAGNDYHPVDTITIKDIIDKLER